jgi:protein-S-isoprenylcysteine O-methyltransferase Ste14
MSMSVKIMTFVVVTIALVWLSRRSILRVRLHGLYRLLGWESIAVLVLLNLDYWFDNWLSFRQIVSWSLLALSTYLVTHGVITLHRSGMPSELRTDVGLVGIEKTTELVTTGIYRHIRHPIYSSAVVGVWGVVLKDISAISASLALMSVLFFYLTAKMEERENISYFGEEYQDYMRKTRMFIPFVF